MSDTLVPAATAVTETALGPAAGDPAEQIFGWFRRMLADEPVHRDENGMFHVFGFADVSRILSDPATFSSDDRAFNPRQQDVDLFAQGNIANMDPPQHRKLRAVVSRVFTPRVVANLAPRIAHITAGLLDEVGDRRRFDLVDALTFRLPVTVIAQLLGVPSQDMPRFRRWAEDLFSIQVAETVVPSEELNAQVAPVLREMNGYLLEHIRIRREHPADDLLSRLTAAQVDGEVLHDEELVGFAGVLLIAGHITTTALLGNSVLCLDRFPQAAAQVRADPDLLPRAIEEVLRFRSPFPRLGRVTTREVRLGDHVVPAGRFVFPWVAAANRDPARWSEPERFDVQRDPVGHLAFGHGIHFCLGAPLARLESHIALRLLLDRYAELSVDRAQVEYHNPYVMIAPRRLSVEAPA